MLAAPLPVLAHDGLYPLCPYILHERQVELDGLELAVELAQTRFEVAEQILVLLDGLWNNDAIERLTYQHGKHDRDKAKVKLEQARWRVERQQATVEQYRLVCSAPFGQELASEKRRALEQAYRRYREADCKVRGLDIGFAEVELEHHRATLASYLALRESGVSSQQDVILTERDVKLMLTQLGQARQRAARCRQEIAEQWGESASWRESRAPQP